MAWKCSSAAANPLRRAFGARVIGLVALLLLTASAPAARAQGASRKPAAPAAISAALPAPSAGWAPPQKQTLTYAVDWRVFPAGTATIHTESDGATQRITVTGDSQGAINLLFRVSDRFQSSFHRGTGCSESFSRQIMEGHRQVSSSQKIDPVHRITSYEERNLVTHSLTRQSLAAAPCVTDILSGLFYAGSQPLEPGSVFHLPVMSAGHVTSVTLHVEARETVRTPTTSYQTVRVQPVADSGTTTSRGKLWIWYTDDQRRIPVQMRVRLFWGTLTFRLTGIENK